MNILLNGKQTNISDTATILSMIEEKKLKKAAVWVNGMQLLSADYSTYTIKDGDEIKILRILGGG